MRRILASAGLFGLIISSALADYNSGFSAYVRGDYDTALREWLPLAREGNISAQRNLAVMYREGRGVQKDLGEALSWFSQAASAGNASAQYELGKLYLEDEAPFRNRATALQWLEAAADQGQANALLALVDFHKETDPADSLRWLEVAGAAGVVSAQIELAERYKDGVGVVASAEVARRWYEAAAAQGSEEAAFQLESARPGIALRSRGSSIGSTEVPAAEPGQGPVVASRPAVTATESRPAPVAEVQDSLPLSVAAGGSVQGVPLPRPKPELPKLSAELPRFVGPVPNPLRQVAAVEPDSAVPDSADANAAQVAAVEPDSAVPDSADANAAQAAAVEPDSAVPDSADVNAVASVNESAGSNVESDSTQTPTPAQADDVGDTRLAFVEALDAYAAGDFATAVDIWEVLANRGVPEAQSNLGAMYEKGLFVERDYQRAVELFTAAAQSGLASAQFNLGIMYAEGRGVARDSETAADWQRRAAAQGHPLATEYLAAIVQREQQAQEQTAAAAPVNPQTAAEPSSTDSAPVQVRLPNSSDNAELQPAVLSDNEAVLPPDNAAPAAPVGQEQVDDGAAALAYARGLSAFTDGDYGTALQSWRALAEQGHLNAMFGLGLLLDRGLGGPPDADRAHQLLSDAADRGHADALHYLTSSRRFQGGSADLIRAADLVRQTTRDAVLESDEKLAGFSSFGLAGMEPYPTWKQWLRRVVGLIWRPWAKFDEARDAYRDGLFVQAFNGWREVALDGDAKAQNNIGVMHAEGQGTGMDLIAATTWFQRAAIQDEPIAVHNTALAGLRRSDARPERVVEELRRAAALGVSAAIYDLGVAHARGFGLEQSMNEAALAFRSAADQGNTLALYNLAVMFERGISFPQNVTEALSLYRAAADASNTNAQLALGLRYARGEGVTQDNSAAAKLFAAAAEAGDPIAQHNLGVLYAYGYTGDLVYAFSDGVSQDLAQAQHWLARAASNGVVEAEERLDSLALRMSDEDRARAASLIEQSNLHSLLN